MAAYTDLFTRFSSPDLLQRTEVAVLVTAQGYLSGADASNEQIAWARQTMADSAATASQVLKAVLAAFKGLTTTAIDAASDEDLQGAVDSVVPRLAAGLEL